MRFRDVFWLLCAVVSVFAVYRFSTSAIDNYRLGSTAVNRDDANRVATTLLHDQHWTEFFVPANALSIRLMTNSALNNTQLPEENQTDPRSGWRYSVEYQVVDARGQILNQSVYHLRSGIRELVDSDTGEIIDPLVFGKTSMVATQTRFIQIPVVADGARPARIRIRVKEKAPQVQEVVARVRTRHERPHYEKRSTWKKISSKTREKLAKYCVFDHKFLTHSERASLLRWQWQKAPSAGESTIRHLYFLGDVDDQEAITDPVLEGTCLEPGWRSTLAIPQGQGNLRLEVQRIGLGASAPAFLTGTWYDAQGNPPEQFELTMFEDRMTIHRNYYGGILELESSEPVCFRSFWKNLEENSTVAGDDDRPLAMGEETELTNRAGAGSLRVYLADQDGIRFPVSHIRGQPTPFRISVRLGYGNAFLSDENLARRAMEFEQPPGWNDTRMLNWQYLDKQGNAIDQGVIEIVPELSAYDRLWKLSQAFQVSEKKNLYFSVPPTAATVVLKSDQPFLVNASVRPGNVPFLTRVPEDSQPFERQKRRTRKWFTLKPDSHIDLIAANRSFVLSTQTRVGIFDQDADANDMLNPEEFVWQRYEPQGDWIGRQVFVPAENDSEIKRRAMFAWFFEVAPNQSHTINEHAFATRDDYRLTYISAAQRPGQLQVWQNGRLVQQQSLMSSRGSLKLNLQRTEDHSTLEIKCDPQTRLFFSGALIDGAARYLKRTACRLHNGELEFPFTKTSREAETLTLSIYREQDVADRCLLEVEIAAEEKISLRRTGPVEHLTMLHRIYDLKAQQQRQTVLLGSDTPLDVEHKCFIQLGEDLPPGEYIIKINRLDGNRRGFVLLHQLKPIHQEVRASP